MVVALDATPQRALAIDFATGTLLYYAVGIMVPMDSPVDTWAELDTPEKSVSVALGTSNDRAITGLLPKANIVRSKTYAEALAGYFAGRVDAVGGSAQSLAFTAREQLGAHKVVIPNPSSPPYSASDSTSRRIAQRSSAAASSPSSAASGRPGGRSA